MRSPVARTRSICARSSRSTPLFGESRNRIQFRGIDLPVVSARSSTRVRCTPTSSDGTSRNCAAASSNSRPFATIEQAVTIPLRWASIAPAVMPRSRPTSSAVTMSCFTNLADVCDRWLTRHTLPHLGVELHQLRENFQDDLRRREMRLPSNTREVIQPDLLNREAAILRLHNQLRIDQRSLGFQIDRVEHFPLEQLE